MSNSSQYEAAYRAHNQALEVYYVAREKYRAGEIGDAEYLAARKIKNEADDVFHAAFALEAGW